MSVSWNGSTITGPTLIYHHEILRDPSFRFTSMIPSSALYCRFETHSGVTWHEPSGAIVATPSIDLPLEMIFGFYQTKTSGTGTPSISVLVSKAGTTLLGRPVNPDGLWSCGQNGASVAVGLYFRGGGEC